MYNFVLNFISSSLNKIYQSPYYQFLSVTITDIVFLIFIAIILVIAANIFAKNKKKTDLRYDYFMIGLTLKLGSVIVFCILYLTIYGGDSLAYFHNMQVLRNLFYQNPAKYFDILFNGINKGNIFFFNNETGLPTYMWKDSGSFFVSRLLSPLTILFGNSFIIISFIVAYITYWGNWKLFLFFSEKHPALTKEMAIAALFIPSVLFWGSGIMKDTIIIFCMTYLLVSFSNLLKTKNIFVNIMVLVICSWCIIAIKPYIIVALLPTFFIWMGYERFQKIKMKLLKSILIPVLIIGIFGGVFFTFSRLAQNLGYFGSYDSMVDRAKLVQTDLLRGEQYGENNYYIGEITGSTSNMIQLFPLAVVAGLFRPYLWEARNIFMLMSGVENFLILLLVLSVFLKRKVGVVFSIIGKDAFLLGLMVFIIFLAFGIGLSTSNFGALVRYRIPLMPVLVASMLIVRYQYKEYMKQFEKKDTTFFTPLGKR